MSIVFKKIFTIVLSIYIANVPLDRVFSIFRLRSLSARLFPSEKNEASYKPTFRWIMSYLSFVCDCYPLGCSQATKNKASCKPTFRWIMFYRFFVSTFYPLGCSQARKTKQATSSSRRASIFDGRCTSVHKREKRSAT